MSLQRTCPSCGEMAIGHPYDIGSGPEFSCINCEWCWGAYGQELDADDPFRVDPEFADGLPEWARPIFKAVA